MKSPSSPLLVVNLLFWPALAAQAQGMGVASLGATGGLNIPSAYVLDSGDAAASVGNYQDPKLGTFSRQRNFTLGFGLGGGVELYGRLTEYTNPPANRRPWTVTSNGPRDLSANLKWQLPIEELGLPALAVGMTDISGSGVATFFRSAYGVASEEWGPLRLSLGYARSEAKRGAHVLNGVFGGSELRLGRTRATLLAETNGVSRHAGLRYYSEELSWLGDAQFVATLQRSFGASDVQGRAADATSFNLSLVMPLQASDAVRDQRARVLAKAAPLRPLAASEQTTGSAASRAERLLSLLRVLRAGGLDRLRVGTLGAHLIVEYENQRYLHNEADALGVVLGLAAELAPSGIERVHAITHKAGLVVMETSVGVPSFRAWLRDEGEAAAVQATLGFGRLEGYDADAVQWVQAEAQRETRVRVALKPLFNYAIGHEFGLFDYSLALQARTSVPLWSGAEAYADLVQPVDHTRNMDPGMLFDGSRHRGGLQSLALQQSFWLGKHLFTSVGAGQYQFDRLGAEGESILFLPWSNDTLHVRGSASRNIDNVRPRDQDAWAGSYRWRMNSTTWVDGGIHAYTDGTTGPSFGMTRWFGDVALNLFIRKGGSNTFAGLEVSLPMAPRQGLGAAPLQLTGSPRFAVGLRTLMANGSNTVNWVRPNAVRTVDLSYRPEAELLNSGRITPDYMREQLPRLRESFYRYARDLLP